MDPDKLLKQVKSALYRVFEDRLRDVVLHICDPDAVDRVELVFDAEPAERRGLEVEVGPNVEKGEAGAAAQPLEGSRQ